MQTDGQKQAGRAKSRFARLAGLVCESGGCWNLCSGVHRQIASLVMNELCISSVKGFTVPIKIFSSTGVQRPDPLSISILTFSGISLQDHGTEQGLHPLLGSVVLDWGSVGEAGSITPSYALTISRDLLPHLRGFAVIAEYTLPVGITLLKESIGRY